MAFSVGPLAVRWYGLMYLLGFAAGWWLGLRRIGKGLAPVTRPQFDDLIFLAVLGVILGGRLGYVLFYKPAYYAAHPLEIFAIWQGGMSFHGGLLGVMLAMAFAAWRHRIDYLRLMDFVAPRHAAGSRRGAPGQLHQRRAVGPGHDRALGHGVSRRGRSAAAPVAALSIRSGGR